MIKEIITKNTQKYSTFLSQVIILLKNVFLGLLQVVLLPKGEDFNDWLAVHVVDFFNRINLIYGTVCEQCTNSTCPTMSGGPKFEYLWQDGTKYKKPTQLPANQVNNLETDTLSFH